MSRIVVSEFVTIDGVMEDPGGSEKTERGGWGFKFNRGPEGDRFKFDELKAADAQLFGRTTYEGFAAAWPSRTGEFADLINGLPKYVVSATLERPAWGPVTVIKSNVVAELSKLKAMPGKDILVAGSARLVNTLVQNNLVDELRLMVFPVILGAGRRLFQEGKLSPAFRLVEARPVGGGVLTVVYQPQEARER